MILTDAVGANVPLAISMPNRHSHRFATYPSDARGLFGRKLGPNTLGEFMTAVDVAYDPETNTTAVGFDFARTGDDE